MIMGDMSDCLVELYSKGGVDHGNLTSVEKETGDLDWVIYTAEDKMILRQYKANATRRDAMKYFSTSLSQTAH